MEDIAEHCGRIRTVDFLNDEYVRSIGIFKRFDKGVHKRPGNKTVSDATRCLLRWDWLIGAYELCIGVIGVECDTAARILFGGLIDDVALAGTGGAEQDPVVRAGYICFVLFLMYLLLGLYCGIQVLQQMEQLLELIGHRGFFA